MHLHVEGVRLFDDAVAAQVVGFGHEGDAVDAAAKAVQLDAQRHLARRDRLAVAIERIDPEVRLDAGLVDRHLHLEVVARQQPRAVRAARILQGAGLGLVGLPLAPVHRAAATAWRQCRR